LGRATSGGMASSATLDANKRRHALMLIITNTTMRESFLKFAKAEHNEENLMLWTAIKGFKECRPDAMPAAASAIIETVRRRALSLYHGGVVGARPPWRWCDAPCSNAAAVWACRR
jgi:predicted aminopeptidase